MPPRVLELREVDRTQVALAGGKGASLGELSRIEGVRVPAGFVVTTEALRTASADELAAEVSRALARLGEGTPCAVRSSATAEDSSSASFAGQLESYLNVVGTAAVLEHVRRCQESLTSERAEAYRVHGRVDARRLEMAVVVQRMIAPRAAGVLFTADPLTGNRRVTTVEASRGLGDALVSGRVNAGVFRVRGGVILERPDDPALRDEELLELEALGRRIEAHFGAPQDLEWCLDDAGFHFVQSRPITTLFPVPETTDGENHVYISVGHQQMMTEPLRPLGLSIWQRTVQRPMSVAGGRLFVDVTRQLASPRSRAALLGMIGRSDPLIHDALETVVARDFVGTLPEQSGGPPALTALPTLEADPTLVTSLMERTRASLDACAREIATQSGAALIEFILADLQELTRLLSGSLQVIMSAMDAAWWLNDRLFAWLGEKSSADVLSQSVPHNVTSEMGLALLDVADAIRPHPEVVALLERADDDFLERLPAVAGGRAARDAILRWLDAYGMRCVGEIDVTRPRWSERPRALVPLLLANVRGFSPGEATRRFERGAQQAEEKARELLERLRALPDGDDKAEQTRRRIERVRTFAGYREFPKYGMVCRYFLYKKALLAEADRLVAAGVLRGREDLFFLELEELREVVRTGRVDEALLDRRREAFDGYHALTPPRVLTSEGEAVSGAYRRDDHPSGALVGLAVSSGVVEGRARVLFDLADADVQEGDILVTRFTDPSWTPLFVAVKGLVTEVGGLMTHGAVIAREYGLPAVVGVIDATRRIRDGQRIRVHGTHGWVELLS